MLVVDDEGLFKNPEHFFLMAGYPRPLAGAAIIFGSDKEGNTEGARTKVEDIEILWMDRNSIRLYEEAEQKLVDKARKNPNYGHVIFTTMKEVLGDGK